jgi:hypothetical protein
VDVLPLGVARVGLLHLAAELRVKVVAATGVGPGRNRRLDCEHHRHGDFHQAQALYVKGRMRGCRRYTPDDVLEGALQHAGPVDGDEYGVLVLAVVSGGAKEDVREGPARRFARRANTA